MAEYKTSVVDDIAPDLEQANKGFAHLVKYCKDQYAAFRKSHYRQQKIDEIDKATSVYNLEEPKGEKLWENATNVNLPLVTIACDNLEPRFVSALAGSTPYVEFEEPSNAQKSEITEILQDWFNQELDDVVDVEYLARSVTGKLLREGTCYPLPKYTIDERRRIDFVLRTELQILHDTDEDLFNEITRGVQAGELVWEGDVLLDKEEAEPVTVEITETVKEGGAWDIIEFADVFTADDVDDWEQADVIRHVNPTYRDLVVASEEKEGYRNIGPWLHTEAGDMEYASPVQKAASIKEHGKKVIPCIECSVRYVYVPDDEEEKDQTDLREERLIVQIHKDSGILLRVIPLRKINFRNQHLLKRIRMFAERGKSYGTSMAKKLMPIQEGGTKTFNLAMNIATIVMMPYYFYDEKTAGIKRHNKNKSVGIQPGRGIPVDNVQGILFPRFSVNPDQLFNWVNMWINFWERLSSIGDLQLGRVSDKSTTATETMAVIQEGNIKHNYQSTAFKNEFLSVLITLYDLYYQHMPWNKTFRYKGQDVSIPRSAMRRNRNFKLTGDTENSNKLFERQRTEQLYSIVTQNPNADPIKPLEELLESYDIDNTDDWISPGLAQIIEGIKTIPGAMEQMPQILNQMAMMAQQQQAAAQQQGGPQNGNPNAQGQMDSQNVPAA